MNTENQSTVPSLTLNDVVKIDTPTTGNRCLIVAEIRQYSGGPLCPMVDYRMVRNPPGTPPIRLRVLPGHGGERKVTHPYQTRGRHAGCRFNTYWQHQAVASFVRESRG